MPIYKTENTLTPQAWANLLRTREDRKSVISAGLEKLGGRLLYAYGHLTGEYHGQIIYELPDAKAAEAFMITFTAAGHHGKTRTFELLTLPQLDAAFRKAEKIKYRAP